MAGVATALQRRGRDRAAGGPDEQDGGAGEVVGAAGRGHRPTARRRRQDHPPQDLRLPGPSADAQDPQNLARHLLLLAGGLDGLLRRFNEHELPGRRPVQDVHLWWVLPLLLPHRSFVQAPLMEVPAVLTVFFLVDRIGRKALLAGGFTIASLCMISNLIIHDAHWMVTMAQFLIAKGSITATYATIYTFTPELFPTVIRNTAMGICSMMARVGAICASYIAMWLVDDYGKIAMILPFASLGLCAAVVIVLLLPETKGRNLAETIEEVEGKVRAHELEPLQPQAAAAADETALPGAATNTTNSSAFAPAAQQPLTAKPEEKSA
ncbi:MFS domain-containing protein [Aphelenchoides fujianensis]|nr:MFS domain-containing protein [Aphelenchoides fujianensis]